MGKTGWDIWLGATRCMINENGEATTPLRAKLQGLSADYIFVRDDGWTLATPAALVKVAYNLWPDEWVGFLKRGSDGYMDIKLLEI